MDQSSLIYNYEVTDALGHAISSGEHGLGNVPGLLKKIIKEGCWRERYVRQTKQVVKFEKFAEFVATKPLEGLGSDIKTLRRLCADDPEALDELEKAIQGKRGGQSGNQNAAKTNGMNHPIRLNKPRNRKAEDLKRLETERPDLYEQVKDKKLKTNTAMVQAGFRPKTITVPADINKAAAVIVRHFKDDTANLIEAIQELLNR